VAPDSGRLEVRGEAIPLPLNPVEAERLGFRFVHQNLGLVPTLSVAENLFLSEFATGVVRHIDWRRLNDDARDLLERYELELDPRAPLEASTPLERAQVAIVRALAGDRGSTTTDGGRLLVLDEPTVYLPRKEVASLFAMLHRVVAAQSAAVLIVTHRMDEILEHTHRVTVLRDARVVSTRDTASSSEDALVKDIVGAEWVVDRERTAAAAPPGDRGDVVTVTGATTKRLAGLDLALAPGAVMGLTGLAGSGYEELVYACFGGAAAAGGTLVVDGHRLDLGALTPRRAMRSGVCLVPADRLRRGVAPAMTIEENLTIATLGGFFRGGRLRLGSMRQGSDALIGAYGIKCIDRDSEVATLSGGNQQKVLVAKWLQTRPRLVLLHEPTQGVDVRARHDIWQAVRELAASGSAVLVASSDYEELATLCTQVAIVAQGRVVNEMAQDELSIDAISTACLLSNTDRASKETSDVA
jgi:ribose transport system ATP-binding protein